jgi:hypothetical protein
MNQKIISIGVRSDYLTARKLAAFRDQKLPSSVSFDEYFVRDRWQELALANLCEVWANEILVYPEKGGRFRLGEDVVDSVEDDFRRTWVLPACYLAKAHEEKEIFGVEKVGLYVDPEQIAEEKGKVIIHPRSIVVLHGLSDFGKADEKTRMPLETPLEVFRNLPEKETRSLSRIDGIGVRPLVYHFYHNHFGGGFADGSSINASWSPTGTCRVAYAESEGMIVRDFVPENGC